MFSDLGMELLFLPPYSSYLNPVERIWGWIKTKWRAYNMASPDAHETDR
jgi:transposase